MDVRSNAELGCNLPLHEEKNESHNPNRPQSAAKSSSAPNAARQIKAELGPANLPKKTAVARTKQSMPESRTHRAIATAENVLLGVICESRKFNDLSNPAIA